MHAHNSAQWNLEEKMDFDARKKQFSQRSSLFREIQFIWIAVAVGLFKDGSMLSPERVAFSRESLPKGYDVPVLANMWVFEHTYPRLASMPKQIRYALVCMNLCSCHL